MVQSFHCSLELGAAIYRDLDIGPLPCRTQLSCGQRQKGGQIWYMSLGHKCSREKTGKGDGQYLKGCLTFSQHAWKYFGVRVVCKTRAQKETDVAGAVVAQSVADIY